MDERITVPKAQLLEKVRSNRDEHASDYAEGITEYRRQAAQRLRELADAVETDENTELFVRDLPKPENHTQDYDTVIQMLEWHLGETIELGIEDFQHFVLDQWQWKERFAASMSNYSPKFSPRR